MEAFIFTEVNIRNKLKISTPSFLYVFSSLFCMPHSPSLLLCFLFQNLHGVCLSDSVIFSAFKFAEMYVTSYLISKWRLWGLLQYLIFKSHIVMQILWECDIFTDINLHLIIIKSLGYSIFFWDFFSIKYPNMKHTQVAFKASYLYPITVMCVKTQAGWFMIWYLTQKKRGKLTLSLMSHSSLK